MPNIDNNQKVGKCNHYIKEGSKIPVSICTTVAHIQTKPATFFQNNKKLSPKNWLGKSSMEVVKQWIFELEDI